ncbi:TPA: hypothetical protein EYP45_00420 [Candidatus Peregrinibacteria bacterium]|nr:hypothetical protein [Candidatus Peregrinibacteria bacterium]
MEITAHFDNNNCSVYSSNNQILGEIIYKENNNRKDCVFEFDNRTITIQNDNWNNIIMENSKVLYNLKVGKLWGKINLQNSENKILGISGFKGGTKMVDKNKKTLITIQSTTNLFKKNHYKIKSESCHLIDIFICLYSHILGSKMKSAGVMYSI